MASSMYVFLLFIAEFTLSLTAASVQLRCKRENHGTQSENSVIDCSVIADKTQDVEIVAVFWKKDESTLFMYYKNFSILDQRLKFVEANWNTKNLNVSLLVTNTQLADDGQYQCEVITDRGEAKQKTKLTVRARYSKPVMSSIPESGIQENMKVEIFCNASWGYPEGTIHWYDCINTNWTRSSHTDVVPNKDKRFNLTSKLTVLQASSSSREYKCVVLNSNREMDGTEVYSLPFAKGEAPEMLEGEKHTVAITAVIVVLGSLVCGLLIVMLFRRKKSWSAAPPEVCESLSKDLNLEMDEKN